MKITKQRLKIILESLILKEGQVEDLLAAEPDLQSAIDIGIKNPSQLKWLVRMKNFEPIADMVGLIPAFIQNKQRLTVKDLDLYRNPNDLRAALEALGESEGDKRRQLKENETDVVYNDEQWIVVMPHTMESSIQWGKGTTWCTAATKSGNLFYNYVGRKDLDIILFYIIKKNSDSRVDNNAKLSVGFVGGKPVADGKKGGLTVNASNHGLTESSLKKILGKKLALIMSAMKSHSDKIEGEHPAKKAMQKIALSKDLNILDKYTAGMNLEEKEDFITTLLDYDLSVQMLTLFARSEDKKIRKRVALDPGASAEVLALLSRDEVEDIRATVAQNPSTPLEVFTRLAVDESDLFRNFLSKNPNTPPEALTILANDSNKDIRFGLTLNPRAPPEVLTLLSRDEVKDIRANVVYNPNVPYEVLARLASDKANNVRISLAYSRRAPPEVLTILASDEDEKVREGAAFNSSTPLEVLNRLAGDESEKVKRSVAGNKTYQKYLASQKQLNERWIRLAGLLN